MAIFTDSRIWVRVFSWPALFRSLFLQTVSVLPEPGLRAHFYGPQAARMFFHTFSGWIVFIAAFIMMFILYSIIAWIKHMSNQ